ncbi:DUF4352 domain-containing protein [Streptomyces spectabilis]|uniref:DUF4352 domain-containing protein n=1 Tax=Streptomyces spectabilis TaxID=68270 RepID=A0A5P2XDF1_STRST|nr:DUF4352 domain-containing protein [Streptomyces spectabilis]MBB5109241.1 hypothetical protein [Streptomyces spectabilis]MCI3906021.1 DUF4352 domain-containing protein [Streptomyces spectabilis]QEV62923.1 DUF4352 domain-containing protein [Streptomyces spectabilis]GGV05294.1 hypothetical protein GCM10010245_11140 [Streptomyces spectabilis]
MRTVTPSLLAALAFLAVGGSAAVEASAAPPAVTAAPSTASAHGPFAPPSDADLGSTLSLTGIRSGERLDVTALKVVDPAANANAYFGPDPGNRFVAVQFRLENTGDGPYKDSPANGAELVDTDGQRFSASWVAETTAGPSFPGSVSISPGDTALGYVTFELPRTAQPEKVQFTMDSGFSDDVGEWDVTTTR